VRQDRQARIGPDVRYRTDRGNRSPSEIAMTVGVDRRVRRTRANLTDALVSLVLERGYDRVTVQDILDRADVGRSTFYAHFRDKESLLLSCFDGLRDDLGLALAELADGPEPLDPRVPTIGLFEHAYRNRRMYRALCGRTGGAIVSRHLHTLVAAALRAHLEPHVAAAGSPVPADAMAEFYTSALLGMLVWWVGQDFPHGPGHIASLYGQLAIPGIRAATTESVHSGR
jgi:AcrR family transcriptional regulator